MVNVCPSDEPLEAAPRTSLKSPNQMAVFSVLNR